MYRQRLQEKKLCQLQKNFKTVLVVGARQVGKSTLLSHCFPNIKHITFDPLTDDFTARTDPVRFLNNFPPPLILDEIQYCPELLAPLKRYVDQSTQKGQYLLTGSQNFSVMKNAAESMAGRVVIMQLDAFTVDEIAEESQNFLVTYLQTPDQLLKKFSHKLILKNSLYEMMWRGCMPEVLSLENNVVHDYLSSYVKTYIERDVRLLENIQNLSDFERFVRLTAALTAQEVNYTHLGRELGISRITATKWLDILKYSYQWIEIPAFDGNAIKRITRKTKGFLHDTGLACYLQYISLPDAVASHPKLGHLFENFIVSNLLKIANTLQTPPNAYHWRTQAGAEVDLILEQNGTLFPIEIKCKSQLTKHDARGLLAFKETYPTQNTAPGVIIYAGNECYQLTDHVFAIPWNAVFYGENNND
jgi:predicted AAA+ superfamily ATPase